MSTVENVHLKERVVFAWHVQNVMSDSRILHGGPVMYLSTNPKALQAAKLKSWMFESTAASNLFGTCIRNWTVYKRRK